MTKYRHTLVYKLDGVQLRVGYGEVEVVADTAAGFHAIVSTAPDDYCFEGDRWIAMANLRLNAIFSQPGLGITQERLEDELEKIRESRTSRFGTGPYLVLMRDDEVEGFSPEYEIETEDFVVCRGGPPRDILRQASSPHVLTALAALAVATGDVSRIKEVSDTVVFFRSDGKPIYCYTLSATANAGVIRAVSEDALGSVEYWYRTIAHDRELERAVRLLVSSLQTEGDALRSFLHAWTALEILINKSFGSYEEQFFLELGEDHHPIARRQYLERMREVMRDKYRLTDKFRLIAALLSPTSADEDVKQVELAKKERDKLTHGQDVHEASLPVLIVQELVRKYIRLHLAP
jgi:hypothetical protein